MATLIRETTNRCRRRSAFVWIAASLAVADAVPADDLYRCEGPNGDTVFSDDPRTCPGAKPHQPQGALQTLRSPRPSRPAESPPARGATVTRPDPTAAMKAHWRAKRRGAELDLHALEARVADLNRFVAGCNRGGTVISEGPDGLRRAVPCGEIRREYDELIAKRRSLRDYLEKDLRRECREAGCLPGWIR
jgi:hypothetical protein